MRHKIIKLLLILMVMALFPICADADYSSKTWSTTEDFQTGTYGNTVDLSGDQIKLKPQTTQADFQAGIVENLDITTSPGDIKLGSATGCPLNPSFEEGIGDDAFNWTEVINNQSGFDYIKRFSYLGYCEKMRLYHPDPSKNFIFKIIITKNSLFEELISYTVPEGFGQSYNFDLSAYGGQTIRVYFQGYQEDNISHYAQVYSDPFICDGGYLTIDFSKNECFDKDGVGGMIYVNFFSFDNITINGYRCTGSFISQTLDYGSVPVSFGYFGTEEAKPFGTDITYKITCSDSYGIGWDEWESITNGMNIDTILTTPRKYLRWKAILSTTNALQTPVLHSTWIGGQYMSSAHNCGEKIERFGIFEVSSNSNGETISYWIQTAPDMGGTPGVWDDLKLVIPGELITFTPYPWIRWGVNLFPSILFQSPVIDTVKINYKLYFLSINDIIPPDNSFEIKTDARIFAEFDRELKALATQYFTLKAIMDNNGNNISEEVSGATEYENENHKLIFTPDSLDKGYLYQVKISTGVEDTEGNHLREEKIWHFSTIFDCMSSNAVTSSNIILSSIISSDNKSRIEILPFTFNKDFYIKINPNPLNNPEEVDKFILLCANDVAQSKGHELLHNYVEINAYDADGMRLTNKLNKDVRLNLFYQDENNDGVVDETNLKEETLRMYYLNEESRVWEKIKSEVDAVNNNVSAWISHFSVYSVMFGIELGVGPYAYPVPFKPNSGLGHNGITFTNLSEETTIKVYTISGKLVRELYKNDAHNEYVWNVKDKDNRDIPSGVYIYYLKTDGTTKKGKLVIIK